MSSSNLLGDGAVANKAASILNKTVSQSVSISQYIIIQCCVVLCCVVLCFSGFSLTKINLIR